MKIQVLFAAAFTWCFQVRADWNTSVQMFYCADPGCYTSVTNVFCNDEPVLGSTSLRACERIPSPNTACHHDGRAFVSFDGPGSCEFEGDTYIKTEKCTDYTTVCKFTSATTLSPLTTEAMHEARKHLVVYIILGVASIVVLVLVLHAYKRDGHTETQHELSRLENGHCPCEHDPGS